MLRNKSRPRSSDERESLPHFLALFGKAHLSRFVGNRRRNVLSTLKSTTKNRAGGKTEEEKEKKEPKYTQEFKEQMVAQYKSGTPARELVQRYGMSKSTLHKWIGDYTRSGSFHAKDNRSHEENELIMLRKELKKLRMENDILKQAALIMAKK